MHERGATLQLLQLTAQNQAHRQALQARTHYVGWNRAASGTVLQSLRCRYLHTAQLTGRRSRPRAIMTRNRHHNGEPPNTTRS